MAGGCTKLSCNRPNHHPNHRHSLEYNISFNRIYRATSLHGVSPFETFFVVELPNEPLDIDQPTRCPATEGCIMEDGLTWKETLAGTLYAQLSRRQWDGMKTTRESAHGPFHSRMQLSLGD
ncbi:uncharacterized protein [Physcomitrium patens]|uniref:Uncharacterized protein n=1 Tax=Physcomitrium patens TaxID=3218 RepID=A0A2K1INC2_PHYPA|nr:uncharacterized protein LOC112275067 [Physcomitrium patens]XP_024360798.1 uncharacterized protein LOC112275067 [Physcomitrium patens]XP_024360799.1 uncharacterized protein LOC112275067 [Physcomitrium patens]XP_024360800.1 uncharacterized protein LOC112275067 [Physcomitrium patens]XP_024360802.1 uncharacterized protein LOC112275067 [Physcomitrium patens]XP_024360803.1 uncharacterized protein LOC112275067 [Physcomitrium patens]XP_024360804.1 uncharacterized protein LOC112275067 [Physcomitriu|eukprot:XP_024360797.1 uncharacterized protein LOC112275067 [Physcomitrella patens]